MVSMSILTLAMAVLTPFASVNAVVPLPRKGLEMTNVQDEIKNPKITFLDPANFECLGAKEIAPDVQLACDRLKTALSTMSHTFLSPSNGANFTIKPDVPNTLSEIHLYLANGSSSGSIAEEAVKPVDERDESYVLDIPPCKGAILRANTTLGLLRGLTTFEQLFYKCPEQSSCNTKLFSVTGSVIINDAPRFKWRGLMLDTARNYISLDAIKRTLEAMSFVKLNTFHWHIVDSQSFPLNLAAYPELAGNASYSKEKQYNEAEIKTVIDHAGLFGIDVVIELDVPAHSAAIGESHPEHVACFHKSPWANYSNEPPAGQLRLDVATQNFTSGLFEALMTNVKSSYMHQGGDEPNAACYEQDNVTQADLETRNLTLQSAYSTFVAGIQSTISNATKTPIGWHEIIVPSLDTSNLTSINSNMTISNDTIIIPWGVSYVKPVLEKGNRIVHGSSEHFYLDCGSGNWIPQNGNSQTVIATRKTWCDPTKSWDQIYTFDPFLGGNVTAAQQPLVLGGQVFLWTEGTSESGLDGRIWPRAAAAAELWWTGAEPGSYPLDAEFALPRMNDIDYRLRAKGVNSMAIQPQYCAMRPGQCLWSS